MVRLYSAGSDLDVGEFSTTLNFSIADIREPDKRNASFSKTMTLPGTKANNLFFENLFEVDVVTQTFNPNLKAQTILSVDNVVQFKGALKLRQVNYLPGGMVTYDCNLIGNISDFIQSLGNSRIRDLDLSVHNHLFSPGVISTSWTPLLGVGYCYPMINYGATANLNVWYASFFRPAVFIKTIWDKIFSTIGFSYSSNFLISDLFKRLIMPNSNDALRLTGTQVNERLFRAGRTTPQSFSSSFSNYIITIIQLNNDNTGGYFDNGGDFDTVFYSHRPNYTGTNTYIFSCVMTFTVVKLVSSSDPLFYTYGGSALFSIFLLRNGILTELNSFYTDPSGVLADAAGTYTLTANINFAAENNVVLPGDSYFVSVKHSLATVMDPALIVSEIVSLTSIAFSDEVVNDVIQLGDIVVLANSLPDMLQRDFVMGIVKMFNLYIEPDPNDELVLNIEPRNDYYNTTQVDWSQKLAAEKELEIEPMAFLNFKRINLTYKGDTDYYNKIYKSEFARVYGSFLAEVNNDFVSGEYKIETNFAPTPLQGNYDNDRIVPAIFEANGNPPVIEPITGEPRILYWKGLTNCQQWDFPTTDLIHDYRTQYPYAGHLDDPQNPTIDLSFGIPGKLFYGVNQFIPSISYTDNNLFSAYYSQMIAEITDRDSKMVTAWLWLNPVDIMTLDFRKIYRIGSHALRLNKVIDYNPVKPGLTKCEFIKIKYSAPFTKTEEIINGGTGIEIGGLIIGTTVQMGPLVTKG